MVQAINESSGCFLPVWDGKLGASPMAGEWIIAYCDSVAYLSGQSRGKCQPGFSAGNTGDCRRVLDARSPADGHHRWSPARATFRHNLGQRRLQLRIRKNASIPPLARRSATADAARPGNRPTLPRMGTVPASPPPPALLRQRGPQRVQADPTDVERLLVERLDVEGRALAALAYSSRICSQIRCPTL